MQPWVCAGNGVAGGYWCLYCPLPEHGCTVHCDFSYNGLVSGGGAEAGTAPIQAMVVESRSVYPGDRDRAGSRGVRVGGGGGRLG